MADKKKPANRKGRPTTPTPRNNAGRRGKGGRNPPKSKPAPDVGQPQG